MNPRPEARCRLAASEFKESAAEPSPDFLSTFTVQSSELSTRARISKVIARRRSFRSRNFEAFVLRERPREIVAGHGFGSVDVDADFHAILRAKK